MTIAYNADVATSRGVGNFVLLLLRWRGSIYKLVYPNLILYLSIYFSISLLYRCYLNDYPEMKQKFEQIVRYCKDYGGLVPVSFVLGFYVSQIVTRWWSQWMLCPWPDNLAVLIATHLQGRGERSRLMRRTIMRYVNLSFTMTMVLMSPQAETRFPTLDHFVEAGYLLQHEKIIIEHLNSKNTYLKYWIPLIWAGNLAVRARREGRINDDIALATIAKAICKFRNGCGDLLGFDWVNIPLVYNQVASLAVYLYFVASLLGQQFIIGQENNLDLVFPLFVFIEFFFYMGWLKVAETMLNPWGEDDDDFEVIWMIDRNFCVSYLIVDEMHAEYPEMLKDQYWDEVIPQELPYTTNTMKYKKPMSMKGSVYYQNPEKSMYTNKFIEKSLYSKKTTAKSMYTRKDADKVSRIPLTATATSAGDSTTIVINADDSRVPTSVTIDDPNREIVIVPSGYKNYMEATFVPMEQDETSTYTIPLSSTYPVVFIHDKSPISTKNASTPLRTQSGDQQVPTTMNSKTKTDNSEDKTKEQK